MSDTNEVLPWRVRRPRPVEAFVSRAARRAAADLGIDIDQLTGTGANGRVTRDDVLGSGGGRARGDEVVPFNSRGDEVVPMNSGGDEVVPMNSGGDEVVPMNSGGDEVVPMNNVRRRAAGLLLASKQTSAHTLCVVRADYSAIEVVRREARSQWRAREGFSLTYLPFVARAVVDALRAYPLVNASVDGETLIVHREISLGIAVDLDFQGLVVPVVRNADGLRLRALARAINDVATRARAKKLTVDDLAGGTFTVTNPGGSGTWLSFPIINQPQVAIVATDGVSKQVIADAQGRLVIAPVGHLCLTFDHRALDGAYAGAFLRHVQEIVETRDWATEL